MLQRLFIYTFLFILCLTAVISSIMILIIGNQYNVKLWIFVLISAVLTSVYSLFQIFKLNKKWKQNQLITHNQFIIKWKLTDIEWKNYKNLYINTQKIEKDAKIYSLIAAIFWIGFSFIIFSSLYEFLYAIIIALISGIVFFLLIFLIVYKVNIRKKLPFINSETCEIAGNLQLIMFNKTPIFLNTPGLRLREIRIENSEITSSAIIFLEFSANFKRITQEHRIPLALQNIEEINNYFKNLRKNYGLE